jgi:hypothetical protein
VTGRLAARETGQAANPPAQPPHVDAEPHDVAPADADAATEYRYPGSSPFADTEIDRLTFRGRRQEIDDVLHSILSVDLFVVYAISGVGKTSLMSAGVMEQLRQRDFFPVIVRLNDPATPPVELIDVQIRAASDKFEQITVSRHPSVRDAEPSTLWDLLASLEVWRGNALQHLVLIFDQFEELFTLDWGDDDRERFIGQLGEVIRRHRTQTAPAEAAEAAETVPLPAPNVKIVLIIREDSLGELEAMATEIPQIMHHRFRLDGLSLERAVEAVREPALLSDPRLATARFTYSDGAADAILEFLRAREYRGRAVLTKSIDPSQLQLICQHVERSVLPGKLAATEDETVEITETDLGGKPGLERILRDFYRNELAALPSKDRKPVQHLCESGLINQNGRRLSLEEGEIAARFGVSTATLEHLVDRRLLRAEPRVGSIYYELAHDTLAGPIISFRDAERSARRRRWRRWAAGVAAAGLLALGALIGLAVASPWSDDVGDGTSVTIGESGESVVAELDMPGDRPAGLVRPPSDEDVRVKLSSPDGSIDWIDDGRAGYPEQWLLDDVAPGRYVVAVAGRPDAEVAVLTGPVRTLRVGQTATGRIDGAGALEMFEFTAREGGPFVVEAVPDTGFDAALEAFDDVRNQRVDAATTGDAEAVVVASQRDPMRVVVSGYGSSVGDFALSVRQADVVPVPFGDTVAGAIAADDVVDVFEFDVAGDGPLVVEVEPDDGLDASLEVIDPNGVVVQAKERGNGIETVLIPAPAPGRYRAVVKGFYSSGAYDLLVAEAPGWLVNALVPDPGDPQR